LIELCLSAHPDTSRSPFSREDLLAEVAAAGVLFQRVLRPSGDGICLLFGYLEDDTVGKLPIQIRRHLVLVAEGGQPAPSEAERTRQSLELLGLIEPRAIVSWRHGLFVSWGLYGRPDVAAAAQLIAVNDTGLQAQNDFASLPQVLGRYLIAAKEMERDLS
jgi:hypothetical protein